MPTDLFARWFEVIEAVMPEGVEQITKHDPEQGMILVTVIEAVMPEGVEQGPDARRRPHPAA